MRKIRQRIKYDNNLLKEYLQKDNAISIDEYPKLLKNTIIKFNCNCGNNNMKEFRNIISTGALCKLCYNKKSKEDKSENKINKYKLIASKRRHTEGDIIKKIKDKYDNIDVLNIEKYQNNRSPLNFKCLKCKSIIIKGLDKLLIRGCINCNNKIENNKISTKKEQLEFRQNSFIDKCNILYPNYFDYSKVNYINRNSIVIIICLTCKNEINTLAYKLMNNNKLNCSNCCIKTNFLDNILSSKYIQDNINKCWKIIDWCNYKNNFDKISVRCNNCNYNYQKTINNLIKNNKGCDNCGRDFKLNKDIIIERFNNIWNNTYDYSKLDYKNIRTPITIICKKHGDFNIKTKYHEKGSGCPKCFPTTELYLLEILKKYYPSIITQFKLDSCKNINHLPFDYCIPEIKTIIELDGEQHFILVKKWNSFPEIQIQRDIFKMNAADKEGYKIIRLTQMDVFKFKEKWILEKLLPEINDKDDTNHIFISSNHTIYDKHIILFSNTSHNSG